MSVPLFGGRDPLRHLDRFLSDPYQSEAQHDREDEARAREDGPPVLNVEDREAA